MALFLSHESGDRWRLEPPLMTVGRAPANAICLPDESVSRVHAELAEQSGRWRVRDLGSRNGTHVNGCAASPLAALRAGDELRFGLVVLRVLDDTGTSEVTLADDTQVGATRPMRPGEALARRTRTVESAQEVVRLLAAAGRQLVRPQPLAATYDEAIRFVEKAVPASRYILLVESAPGGEMVPAAVRAPGGRPGEPLVLSKAILRTVVEERSAVLTRNPAWDRRFADAESLVALGVRSAVAVPLFDEERLHGILYVDSQDPALQFGAEHLDLLTLLGDMLAVKMSHTRLLAEEQENAVMRQQMGMAARIQRGMLQADLPQVAGYEIDAFLEPCYAVGGDLYDLHVCREGQLFFLLGDVSGKGLGAAILMASFLASARVLYDICATPEEMARRLSESVYRHTDPMNYVTGVVGCLETATGTLRYVNAGHPAPLVVGAGCQRELAATGAPFGLFPDAEFACATARLEPGDLLAAYSDGIIEARRGREFFESGRLRSALAGAAAAGPLPGLRDAILAEVDRFLAGEARSDDVTLLLIRRAAAATPPGSRPRPPSPGS